MPSSDDINNLFARFGGRPENYHEIERADEARESESRWPLLSALNGHAARPAAAGAQQRTEPSLGLPPTMPDPTRADTVRPPAAAPLAAPAAPAAPARWANAPAAQPKPGAPVQAAAPAAEADPGARFQFIAPRPRGGVHPGHVRPSPPDTLAEAAARDAAEAAAPAQPFRPFGAPAPAGPAAPQPAPRTEPSFSQRAPAASGASDSPFAAFRSAPATPARAAEAPAEDATSTGALAGVFQRLSQPSEHPPEPEPRGIFQRLVNR